VRIGVIADTHIPVVADKLPDEVFTQFRGVDMILHAGDLVTIKVLDSLSKLSKTIAVQGNMDYLDVRKALPVKTIVESGKFRIGLIHGWGPPWGLVDRIKNEFRGVDVVIFGHTHEAFSEVINNVLFFNPGTPTDIRFSSSLSIGLLEIGDQINASIIHL
jgi:putative phosphoesterase